MNLKPILPSDLHPFGEVFVDRMIEEIFDNHETDLFDAKRIAENNQVDLEGGATTSLGASLTSSYFASTPIAVPVMVGENPTTVFKRELVLERNPSKRTIKLMEWLSDDPREKPHDHPFEFDSKILEGGYEEEVFWLENGEVKTEMRSYKKGDINRFRHGFFHNVRSVEKGTATLLLCGPSRPGNPWGYLDINTGNYVPHQQEGPANAKEFFMAANPHLAKS